MSERKQLKSDYDKLLDKANAAERKINQLNAYI